MPHSFKSVWKETDDYVFTTGENHTPAEQLEFNNVGFANYFVDMTMDVSQFENLTVQLNFAFSLCLYMHTKDGEFVGFSRTATRGNRAWLAGISIVPSFRGRKIGPLLFTEYINLLKTRSTTIAHLQFECVTANDRAMKLYLKMGCRIDEPLGELRSYQIDVTSPALATKLPSSADFVMRTKDSLELGLPWLQHATGYTWQREFSVLLSGLHRQYVFKRKRADGRPTTDVDNDADFEVALAVEIHRKPPRVNGIAYHARPDMGVLLECLKQVARDLDGDIKEIVFANEPECSDITPTLGRIVRRNDLMQKQLLLTIDRE